MASTAERVLAGLQKSIGKVDGPSDWHTVDQAQIDAFADLTGDHQFIHVDPAKARQTPYGTTIAHGFLTLSMITQFMQQVPPPEPNPYKERVMGVNYGLDRVRFPNAVKSGSRIRGTRELLSAELVAPNTIQTQHKVTVEIEGESKPACVAEWLTRSYFA
jgi:acyl dehydratase